MQVSQQLSCLSRVRSVALDLDGVVYHGKQLIAGADEAVVALRQLGLTVYFVSNNSFKTRAEITTKLTQMGIQASEEEILNSGYGTGILLKRLSGPEEASAFVIGSDGLKAEIASFGIKIVESIPCKYLIVGLDFEFTYKKICFALDAIRDGAIFIACNRDNTFPVEGGRILPGCGPLVAAIEAACGKSPDYQAGKPQVLFLEILAQRENIQAYEILVVGDTIESDIVMANRFGSPSMLVLPVGSDDRLAGLDVVEQKPLLVVRSLAEIPNLVRAAQTA